MNPISFYRRWYAFAWFAFVFAVGTVGTTILVLTVLSAAHREDTRATTALHVYCRLRSGAVESGDLDQPRVLIRDFTLCASAHGKGELAADFTLAARKEPPDVERMVMLWEKLK